MSISTQPTSLPLHLRNLTHAEAAHYDYFRLICAQDFALSLNSALWATLLPQTAHREPSIYHAALAIAALSKDAYSPRPRLSRDTIASSNCNFATEFAITHYNLAIRTLNGALKAGSACAELALLACILFIYVEAFQGCRMGGEGEGVPHLVKAHINGGLAIVRSLKLRDPEASTKIEYLETALHHTRNQIEQLEQFSFGL
ncbi:hypothetical protein G7Y89_g15737 [Cudoniella acicularis]|uniref:Uncharacterized protein n=1 Tax=Cudoniella acicularis TaxID=354080 RepID=A0A8H4QG22_9HELO|nr:hypothetical protein G7Y89_g15737 [Cudoniella acicularis]